MAIYIQQSIELGLFGDGLATTFSYDFNKAPIAADSDGVALAVGSPSSLGPVVWVATPQVGIDGQGNAIYDEPSINAQINGTIVSFTFGSALKAYGSIFTDGNSNPWQIGPYILDVAFNYNG